MLSYIEAELLDTAIVPPKAGKEAGTHELATEEAPTDTALQAGIRKEVEVDEDGKEIEEAHPSTPPTINNPPSLSFSEVGNILSSSAAPTSSSLFHYAQYYLKKSITPRTLVDISAPNRLNSETHHLFKDLQHYPQI